MKIERVAIVGVGLIGGSIGLAARGGKVAQSVVGVGSRAATLADAHSIGAISEIGPDLKTAVAAADLVVVCAGRRDRRTGSPLGAALPTRHADHRRRQHQGGNRRRRRKAHGRSGLAGRRAFRRRSSVGWHREEGPAARHGRFVRGPHRGHHPHRVNPRRRSPAGGRFLAKPGRANAGNVGR